MKYELTKDWLDYKKGHVFDTTSYEWGSLWSFGKQGKLDVIVFSLLLHTGILEEVTEERWKPKDGHSYWELYVNGGDVGLYHSIYDDGRVSNKCHEIGNCFETEEQAIIARDKVKELLLSLHNK
jgi:hypothetical protein